MNLICFGRSMWTANRTRRKARWHRSLLRLLWGTSTSTRYMYWSTTVVHTTHQGNRRAAVWRRVRHMRQVRDGSQHEMQLFHFCWIQLRTSLYIAVECYRLPLPIVQHRPHSVVARFDAILFCVWCIVWVLYGGLYYHIYRRVYIYTLYVKWDLQ